MNVDAQEAVLGLLSMGHNYFSQPTPSTSSATLNSILTTTASPVIPQKRKQSAIDESESSNPIHYPLQYPQPPPLLRLTHSPPPPEPSPRSNSHDPDVNDTSSEAVDCICGFAVDDGFSIACDICSRWCHSACFGIAPGGVPEKFACWTCKPRSALEKEKAVRLQREKLGMGAGVGADGEGKEAKHRRRSSPGFDRKQRRGTNAAATVAGPDSAGSGKKRQRRPSMMQQQPAPTTVTQTTPSGGTEEEQIDVDSEPWRESYVHIVQDIIPNDDTREKLRRQAAHWRGVTAVSPETPSPISVKPLSHQFSLNPFLSQNLNSLVLPPAFSLHTTQPIPSHALITPFRSCITSSSSYLADPLNAYAHLGMPKPYVHLMGPPLDVALDARIVGNQGRFARWGCKPNAVLRPVLCERGGPKDMWDEGTLTFGVFATRDLKANEEVVLGWEWDDGNAVHHLPALLEAPDMFPHPSSNSAHQVQLLKNQMSNILHALSSTFTTCACGALARDCALTQMAAFVDGHDLTVLARGKNCSGDHDSNDDREKVDIGPLVGRKRGFRTRERIPFSGGMGGMEMVVDEYRNGTGLVWDGKQACKEFPPLSDFVGSPSSPSPTKKGKEKATGFDNEEAETLDSVSGDALTQGKRSAISIHSLLTPSQTPSASNSHPLSEPRPPDPPDEGGGEKLSYDELEDRMPPKMRKKWMHRELEARRELSRADRVGLGITLDSQDEQQLMPPPPMPASMDPTTITSTTATFKSPISQVSHPPRPFNSRSTKDLTSAPSSSPTLLSSPSPLPSFALLSLLSPSVQLHTSSPQGSFPTRDDAIYLPTPPLDINVDKENELVRNCTSPPRTNGSPTATSTVSFVEISSTEHEVETDGDVEISAPVPIVASYSRRHDDDDDEVDYSPHSPEPSHEHVHNASPTNLTPPFLPSGEGANISDGNLGLQSPNGANLNNPYDQPYPIQPTVAVPPPSIQPATPTPTPNPRTKSSSPASAHEPQPSQPPPPKVKMSLKDFALRKKRQREEQALAQGMQASPVMASPVLPEVDCVELSPKDDSSKLEGLFVKKNGMVVNGIIGKVSPPTDEQRAEVARGGRAKSVAEDSNLCDSQTTAERPETTNDNETPQDSISQSALPKTPCQRTSLTPNINGAHSRVGPPYTMPSKSPQSIKSPQVPPIPTRMTSTDPKLQAREMKQEQIESSVPLLQRVSGVERSLSPISPDPTPLANRISQEEDGEIGEIIQPSISRAPTKRDSNLVQRPLSSTGPPFSHSPPTGPRHSLHNPTSPSNPVRSSSTQPPATNNNTNGNRPNLPTAPRALRQSMLHNRSGSGLPLPILPSLPASQGNPLGSSHHIPRGPSADRERDRIDWEQRHYRGLPAPPRRGGQGNSWGR